MGGHAFKHLHTPRISPELYLLAKSRVTKALLQLFHHVTVPFEMPSKVDYGDIDFLVAAPLYPSFPTSASPFDYRAAVTHVKNALNTPHGRKGILTGSVMFFAISAPDRDAGGEPESWIQIDLKVCECPEMWEWTRFNLNYASFAKMIGSMMKPLGLTSDLRGLHIRVEGLEKVGFEKSMVWLSKDPMTVLKIVGLDRRMKDGGFKTNDDVYEYIASSWSFNPAHFAKRLTNSSWVKRLENSPPAGLDFVRRWIPEHYPGYVISGTNPEDLEKWFEEMRIIVKDKIFAMFPEAAREYYEKCRDYLKEVKEHRLQELIMAVIPIGTEGWCKDFPQPTVVMKPFTIPPQSSEAKQTVVFNNNICNAPCTISGPLFAAPGKHNTNSDQRSTSPTSSVLSAHVNDVILQQVQTPMSPLETPILTNSLPRDPPVAFIPRPPPESMSQGAKLECLYRWTLFSPDGHLFLTQEPRDKKFIMKWADAEVEEVELVKWAQEMWWPIWTRQFRVNYVGMWKRRMEKEDREAEAKKLEEKNNIAEQSEADERMSKVMNRLVAINTGREGLVNQDAPKPTILEDISCGC